MIKRKIKKQGVVNTNINMIDTSKITDMSCVFYESLHTLDVSGWDVSNVM